MLCEPLKSDKSMVYLQWTGSSVMRLEVKSSISDVPVVVVLSCSEVDVD